MDVTFERLVLALVITSTVRVYSSNDTGEFSLLPRHGDGRISRNEVIDEG